MSKLATQRLNFVLTAAGAASVAAVVIFFVPSPLNDWLAVAIIGILSCVISKLMGSRRLRHPQSFVSNERAPDTAETWSAEQWKAWASEQADFLKAESEAVASRERRLAEKLARHYEVLEFPSQNDFQQMEDNSAKLSEADRQVQELLEAEAAAVYEKIRSDAYRVDGEIQIEAIRSDLVHLVEQVARVYQPDSQSPFAGNQFQSVGSSIQSNLFALFSFARTVAAGYSQLHIKRTVSLFSACGESLRSVSAGGTVDATFGPHCLCGAICGWREPRHAGSLVAGI